VSSRRPTHPPSSTGFGVDFSLPPSQPDVSAPMKNRMATVTIVALAMALVLVAAVVALAMRWR